LSEGEPVAAQGSGLFVGVWGDAFAVLLMSLATRRTLEMSSAVIVSESVGAGADALGTAAFDEELDVGDELVLALPPDVELQPATASDEIRTAATVDVIRRIISPPLWNTQER
jgi:hypothetical protein